MNIQNDSKELYKNKRAIILHVSPTAFTPPWSEGQKNNLLAWMFFLKDHIVFDVVSNERFDVCENINIICISNPNKTYVQKIVFTWQISQMAKRLLTQRKYDYIFFNISSYNILIPIILLRKIKNAKKVLILGGEKIYKYLEENRIRLGESPLWLKRFILSSFDKILVVSKKIKREIIELNVVDQNNVFQFPAMSSVQFGKSFEIDAGESNIRSIINYTNSDFVILYIGNVKPERGVFVLLQAMKNLSHLSQIKLLICSNGLGDVKKVKNEIKKLKLLNVYIIEQPVRLCDVFTTSSVFVLPMLTQTHVFEYPLSILESLWFSVPVVCSDVESFKELIKDGYNGLLFKTGSVTELTESFVRLIKDPFLYNKTKSNSKISLENIYPINLKEKVIDFLEL